MVSVLVVDDEPDVRLVARVVLEQAGYEVEEADSGESALARLEQGFVPDVMILDLRMPGIDGWEVLGRVRTHGGPLAELPIVVCTAHLSSPAEAPVPFGEHDTFLPKPFHPEALIEHVVSAN